MNVPFLTSIPFDADFRFLPTYVHNEQAISGLNRNLISGFYISVVLDKGNGPRVVIAEIRCNGLGYRAIAKMQFDDKVTEIICDNNYSDIRKFCLDVFDTYEKKYGGRNHEDQENNFWFHAF